MADLVCKFPEEWRRVQRVLSDGSRSLVAGLHEIRAGESFVMFEGDGTPFLDGQVFKAVDDGRVQANGISVIVSEGGSSQNG